MLLLITALVGCSSLSSLNAITPDGQSYLSPNIAYDQENQQQLDIYRPQHANTTLPVIIFFYGGRWQSGSRQEYAFVGQSLADRGFITVIPDYRLYPTVDFPIFIEDAAKATQWVLDNIHDIGGDPSKVYLMGHSAGAHIAAMLITNSSYLTNIGAPKQQLKGLISLSDPLNFNITDDDIKKVFAKANSYKATQPISFVDGNEPSMLLLHGLKDTTLSVDNSYSMAKKVNRMGGDATVIVYKDMAHIGLLLALANVPFLYFAPVLDDIESFINNPLKNKDKH